MSTFYEPSPEQILAECLLIQSEWTLKEKEQRIRGKYIDLGEKQPRVFKVDHRITEQADESVEIAHKYRYMSQESG